MAETYITQGDVDSFVENNPDTMELIRKKAKAQSGGDPIKEKHLYDYYTQVAAAKQKSMNASLSNAPEPSPIDTLSKDVESKISSGAAEAEQAAAAPVPAEALSLQPTVAQSAQVFDMSSYTARARALAEMEANTNCIIRIGFHLS